MCNSGFGGVDCSVEEDGDLSPHRSKRPRSVADMLAASSDKTCIQKVCNELCSFGGACTSSDTCQCYDHWGHGPPASVEAASTSDGAVDPASAGGANLAGGAAQLHRKPMAPDQQVKFNQLVAALGLQRPSTDPCQESWAAAHGQDRHVMIAVTIMAM